ncbi:hypothetical protein, partial [Staphylococcus hominis]
GKNNPQPHLYRISSQALLELTISLFLSLLSTWKIHDLNRNSIGIAFLRKGTEKGTDLFFLL